MKGHTFADDGDVVCTANCRECWLAEKIFKILPQRNPWL